MKEPRSIIRPNAGEVMDLERPIDPQIAGTGRYPGYRDSAAAEAGKAADTRTVILIASTGVLAAVTVALGAFFVDWNGEVTKNSTGIRRQKAPILRLTSKGIVF